MFPCGELATTMPTHTLCVHMLFYVWRGKIAESVAFALRSFSGSCVSFVTYALLVSRLFTWLNRCAVRCAYIQLV